MNNNYTVSIALCTYNGEKYLREQLDSIAVQTRLPDEVIVGDDCSTDATIQILKQWAKEVPFPVIITQNERNFGFAKNFEATINRCSGDFIFLCDQDDVWLPNKTAKMSEELIGNPNIGIVFCAVTLIDQHGAMLSNELARQYYLAYPPDSSIYYRDFAKNHSERAGCMMAIRRSIVDKVYPLPPLWAHDVWLFAISPLYSTIKTLPDVLMKFRRHGNNASALGKEPDWANGRDVYYLTSVGQYRAHTPLREGLLQRLSEFPPSEYRDGYIAYLKTQDKHFGNRCKIEDNFWANLHTLVIEILSGRYFQHKQPFKSILFDIKEGITHK